MFQETVERMTKGCSDSACLGGFILFSLSFLADADLEGRGPFQNNIFVLETGFVLGLHCLFLRVNRDCLVCLAKKKKELMNCLCIKRGILRLWVNC